MAMANNTITMANGCSVLAHWQKPSSMVTSVHAVAVLWQKQFICAKITIKQITQWNERNWSNDWTTTRKKNSNTNIELNAVAISMFLFFRSVHFNVHEFDGVENENCKKQTNDRMDCRVAAGRWPTAFSNFIRYFFVRYLFRSCLPLSLLLYSLALSRPLPLFWLNSYWLLFCMCWPTFTGISLGGLAGWRHRVRAKWRKKKLLSLLSFVRRFFPDSLFFSSVHSPFCLSGSLLCDHVIHLEWSSAPSPSYSRPETYSV